MAIHVDSNPIPLESDPGHNPMDIKPIGLPTDVIDRIPTLSSKEGLGSTHSVTVGIVAQPLNCKEAFERAKADAKDDGIETAKRIHEYGITDQKMLFEIAKIMVSQGSFIYAPNSITLIANFIKDSEMRFEIAKMIAHDSRKVEIEELITEFGITDSYERFEIAKSRIQQDPAASCQLFELLKKIADQNMLFEIAKIIVASPCIEWLLVGDIKELGITDQSMLYELAKIIVSKYSRLLSETIKEFGITNPNMVFELANICVANGGFLDGDFLKSIATYGLTEQMRFELAKMEAARSCFIYDNIADYGITDQTMLFEIAKIGVAHLASTAYRSPKSYLLKFDISDPNRIYEIMKIFISHGNREALGNIGKTLSLVDEEHQIHLLQLYSDRICDLALTEEDLGSLVSAPDNIDESKKRLFSLLKAFTLPIPATFENTEEKAKVEKQLREAYIQLKAFAVSKGVSSKVLESLEELFIKDRRSLHQQKKDLFWLSGFVLHYALDPALPQSPLNDEELIPFLKCIGKMTDTLLRKDATKALMAIYQHTDKIRNLKSLLTGKEERHYLFVLFAVSLGLEPEHTTKIVEELSAAKYKDAAVMASIYQMMSALGKSSLPDAKKKQFLQQIFNPPVKKNGEAKPTYNKRLEEYRKNQRNAIAAVISLFYFGQEQILREVEDTTTLVSKWQTYMGQVFEIKSDNLSNFLPTFGSSKRRPNGLMTYAARLQTLPKQDKDKLMPLLGKFASAVLDGTFHQMRYDITNNRHMQALFSDNGDLLKKWQTSLPIKIEGTSSSGKTISSQERVQKLMRDALDNHHLGKEIAEEVEGLCQTVLNPKTDLLQLQTALESLQKLFTDPSSQFHHDLKGMMTVLTAPEAPAKKWIIEDTDAWEDFLLMGTEPDNSCQHIERNPQYNKCVIASMWDPKIRLMVARDPESGKILGRVVYRILLPKREIFVERLYIKNGINYDEVKRDILEGCRQKAEVMGSTLVASANDSSGFAAKRYPVTLQSLGGPAPYEYVDALSGIENDGVYSLNNNVVIWSPPSPPKS